MITLCIIDTQGGYASSIPISVFHSKTPMLFLSFNHIFRHHCTVYVGVLLSKTLLLRPVFVLYHHTKLLVWQGFLWLSWQIYGCPLGHMGCNGGHARGSDYIFIFIWNIIYNVNFRKDIVICPAWFFEHWLKQSSVTSCSVSYTHLTLPTKA